LFSPAGGSFFFFGLGLLWLGGGGGGWGWCIKNNKKKKNTAAIDESTMPLEASPVYLVFARLYSTICDLQWTEGAFPCTAASMQQTQGKAAKTGSNLLDGGDDRRRSRPGRPSKKEKKKQNLLTSTTGAERILCVASVLSADSTLSPGLSVTTGPAGLAGSTSETFESIRSLRSSSSLILFSFFALLSEYRGNAAASRAQ